MYYYLLYVFEQRMPKHRAVLIIFLLQGLVAFSLWKVVLCELVGYEEYVRYFRESIIVLPYTIVLVFIAILNHRFFSKYEQAEVHEKWEDEKDLIRWGKSSIVFILNIATFVYFDDLVNSVRHYW